MTLRLCFTTLALACSLSTYAVADDVEVLARGPIHEAYAEPSEREPAPTPVIPKEPPKAIEELPPDQKPEGDNVLWLPGYWAWDEDKKDHIWISGFWRNAPPGRTWVPGSWRKVEEGWQWSGGFWAAAKENKAQMDYLPKPPAPLDVNGAATPAPSDNHVYVPGSWVWRDRYVWRPGFWSEHRAGWVWVSAHYRWSPAGYMFIDGYWDYPLAERGILFAPVYIRPAVYAVPTYVYTPTVIVREECLYGAFFTRRGFGCYYFGDYFAPSYSSIGFVAWSGHVSATVTIGGWHDPLFSYYRCGYRHDPFWRGGIATLYVGRYRGDYLRPPTTLVQQNTVINNITNNTTIVNKTTNLNNVTMLSSLNDAGRGGRRNLQAVSDPDRKAQQQAARNVRDVATKRATMENELASKPLPKTGAATTGARSLTLDVPQRPVTSKPTTTPTKVADPGVGNPLPPTGPKPTPLGKVDPKPGINPLPKTDPKPGPVVPKGATTPMVPSAKTPLPKVDPKPGPVAPKVPTTPTLPPKSTPPTIGEPRVGPRVDPKPPPSSPLPKVNPLPKNNPPPPKALPPAPKVPVSPLPTGPKPSAVPPAPPPARPAVPPPASLKTPAQPPSRPAPKKSKEK